MGISISEFQIVMETLGAKKLSNRKGCDNCSILVPGFEIEGIEFFHSGSYYVVYHVNNLSYDVMSRAMTELGEVYPGGSNFWWWHIRSVKVMLTLATMLRGDYSKELVAELTNNVYKKLLECSLIKSNIELPFEHMNYSPKMRKLIKLLKEYRNIVNPFGNCNFKIKEPIEYWDKLQMQLLVPWEEGPKGHSHLRLQGTSFKTYCSINPEECIYKSFVSVQKDRQNGYVYFYHYCCTKDVDGFVKLAYVTEKNSISLKINLQTGLAVREFYEVEPATEEDINVIIYYLKLTIKSLKKRIIRSIVDTVYEEA